MLCDEVMEESMADDHLCPDPTLNDVERLEIKYPPKIMRDVVGIEFNSRLSRIRESRDKMYADNDARRAAGMSFQERQKLLDRKRLEFYDKYEAQLTQDVQRFQVRPFFEWLPVSDYYTVKKRGIAWAVRLYFDNVYQVTK